MHYFHTRFLEEADKFIARLDAKTAKKVFYNVDLAEQTNDPKLFKKLQNEIWEFRSNYSGLQIRLLSFWDKSDGEETLVIAALGFIKKGDFTDALRIARSLLFDEHDLIHKAVGWMLREIGKRDRKVEVAFLDKYAGNMPRTALRYAIEKFDQKEREKYLKMC